MTIGEGGRLRLRLRPRQQPASTSADRGGEGKFARELTE